MPLYLFYNGAKKSKMTKNSNQGGSCLYIRRFAIKWVKIFPLTFCSFLSLTVKLWIGLSESRIKKGVTVFLFFFSANWSKWALFKYAWESMGNGKIWKEISVLVIFCLKCLNFFFWFFTKVWSKKRLWRKKRGVTEFVSKLYRASSSLWKRAKNKACTIKLLFLRQNKNRKRGMILTKASYKACQWYSQGRITYSMTVSSTRGTREVWSGVASTRASFSKGCQNGTPRDIQRKQVVTIEVPTEGSVQVIK